MDGWVGIHTLLDLLLIAVENDSRCGLDRALSSHLIPGLIACDFLFVRGM